MNKIEIKPSDDVLFQNSYCISNRDKDNFDPADLNKILMHQMFVSLESLIEPKLEVKEIPHEGYTEWCTRFYLFTPKQMEEFITGIQESTLELAGIRVVHANCSDHGRD